MQTTRVLATVFFLASLSGSSIAQSSDDALSAKVDEIVRAQIREQKIPGVGLAVMRDGKIVKAAGYGLANVELNVPVTPQSLFHTESMAKTFTATAVMMMVEEGKVGLDDRISKYLPEAPTAWNEVTIRQLLSHTSGIRDYFGEDGDMKLDLHQDFTEDELFRKFASQTMKFKPGEKRSYCNAGYVILGVMIRRVTGKFWFDFVQERIFKPLEMSSTRLINTEDIISSRVSGYVIAEGGWKNEPCISSSIRNSADGELYTNVIDIAKFDEALYTEKLLKRSTLNQMWTLTKFNNGVPTSYNGLGWFIAAVNGHRLIWHDGVGEAFTTGFYRYVDDRFSIVVFVNLGEDDEAAMPWRIADKVAAVYVPALGSSNGHETPANLSKMLNLPGPDLQNLMLGTWSLKAHAASPDSDLGDGTGSELWYAGPGANSLVEELHIADPKGQPIDAFGPAWWDPQSNGQRFIWCTNNLPEGCIISNDVMSWDHDRYVYSEDVQQRGQRITHQEVFSEIKPNSFTQTISQGPSKSSLKPVWIAQATKLPAEGQRMSFPAPSIGKADDQSRAGMQKLIDAFSGSWAIYLTYTATPNGHVRNDGSGDGEETWVVGPGANSLIEQYHSIGADGDISGLGIFWPSAKGGDFQVLWCDNSDSSGCRQLKNAEWKDGHLILTEEHLADGKKRVFREVFAFDTPDSFTQTLADGDPGAEVKPFVTIHATKKAPTLP